MSSKDENPALNAGLAILQQLERDGHLINHAPGWQPPPVTVDDFQTWEDVAIRAEAKLHRIRELLDKRTMDPHLRLEFLAALEHGEGCGCYYCLGPRPGISPPPLEINDGD